MMKNNKNLFLMVLIKNNFLFIIIITLITNLLKAAPLVTYHETVRSLGMGGVRVADSNTAIALAWNPAYLAFNSGLNFSLVDGGVGLNGLQAYNSFSNVNWGGGLSAFSNLYGKPLWVGAWGWTALSWFQFGGYYLRNYEISAMLKDPGVPALDVTYFDNEFYILGYGVKVNNFLSLGVNLKRIVRTGGDATFSTAQLLNPNFTNNIVTNIQNALNDKGEAYGVDIGMVFRPSKKFNPTLSISWQDFGHTSFAMLTQNQSLKPIKENLILTATFQESFLGFGMSGGLEYRHIRNDEEQLGKKIHAGLEFTLLFLDLRLGLYQGYTSYGLGTSFWLFNLDAVLYNQEMGVYPGHTPQERILISLNIDLSLDPDFKIRDQRGERRQLFRRR